MRCTLLYSKSSVGAWVFVIMFIMVEWLMYWNQNMEDCCKAIALISNCCAHAFYECKQFFIWCIRTQALRNISNDKMQNAQYNRKCYVSVKFPPYYLPMCWRHFMKLSLFSRTISVLSSNVCWKPQQQFTRITFSHTWGSNICPYSMFSLKNFKYGNFLNSVSRRKKSSLLAYVETRFAIKNAKNLSLLN